MAVDFSQALKLASTLVGKESPEMDSFEWMSTFPDLNVAYNATFRPHKLSVGLVAPVQAYALGQQPDLEYDIQRVQLAESLGYSAVWLRDVPFDVPTFGDVGQVYDPFVYLGVLSAQTQHIALGVGSIVLPLRHPTHVAKSAASVDVLSGGRLLLGVASGDRPEEYPAMAMSFEDRGERFRDAYDYIRQLGTDQPSFTNSQGHLNGQIDLLPKPVSQHIPMLITGASQQSPEWLATHGDGWMTYPRNVQIQQKIIHTWRQNMMDAGVMNKPAMQSLYIDLVEDADAAPEPIHLGFRSGIGYLIQHLKSLRAIGINHVALNLRFNQADIELTMRRISEEVIPFINQ